MQVSTMDLRTGDVIMYGGTADTEHPVILDTVLLPPKESAGVCREVIAERHAYGRITVQRYWSGMDATHFVIARLGPDNNHWRTAD